MNYEYFMFEERFNLIQDFSVVALQIDRTLLERDDEKFLGFVQTLKNFIARENHMMEDVLLRKVNGLETQLKRDVTRLNALVEEIKVRQDLMIDNQTEMKTALNQVVLKIMGKKR